MAKNDTHKLDWGTDILSFDRHPFGLRPDEQIDAGYITLPVGMMRKTVSWRLVLEIIGKNAGLLPLEIVDDVIVGRGVGEGAPTLDLTVLEALENGVSRQHALLRPAKGGLYLLDLESSNGTHVNGIRLGRGVAHGLSVQDSISLGKLKLTVFSLERFGVDEEKVVTARMNMKTGPGSTADMPVPTLPKVDESVATTPKTAPIDGRGESADTAKDKQAEPDAAESPKRVSQSELLAALDSMGTRSTSAEPDEPVEKPPGDTGKGKQTTKKK